MAKATASHVTHIRYTSTKKCHIALVAPNGSAFKATTIVQTPVRDATNHLTWTPRLLSLSADKKRMKVQLTADNGNRGTTDTGTLTITLTDSAVGGTLPVDIDAAVDPLPVDYADGSD